MERPKIDTEEETAFHKALLQAMEHMATVVAYMAGATYLFHEASRRAWLTVPGLVLFGLSLMGAQVAARVFVSEVLERYPHIRHRRTIAFAGVLALFAVFASVPIWVYAAVQ